MPISPASFIDDPAWASFIPEWKEASSKRHLPAHEDCSRLDVEAAAEHLRAGGTLGSMDGYEERPGQIDMLSAIVRAFNTREHLMVEAGTGVGKSLAYLVPSILWAWANDTPVVVSTATRNLQSQLMGSDIPRARRILGDDAEKFKVALLKGRDNYLCLRSVDEFFAPGYWTMSREDQEEMPNFIEWLTSTADGDLDSYGGRLPRTVLSCPGEECAGRRCRWYSRCFVYRARRNAADAHLVVVNHALVLAEATSAGSAILPAYGRLVLDEAHNLESIATDFLSFEFSRQALVRIMNRLARRGRGRNSRPSGVFASVNRLLQKGALEHGVADHVRSVLANAPGAITRAVAAADDVADLAAKLLEPVKGAEVLRYRVSDFRRRYSVRGLFKEYSGEQWDEDRLAAAQTQLEEGLAALVKLLHDLRDTLLGAVGEGEANPFAELAAQANSVADSLVGFANETDFVLRGDKDTHAYWAERVRQEKRRSYVRLVAAPLSVADDLAKLLYDLKDSVVLTSATLRVGNSFKYEASRLGARGTTDGGDGRFRTFVASSPFDYLSQSLVLAPDCLPDPSSDPKHYAEALAPLLCDLFRATRGRGLVLFTAYDMMNEVADAAHGIFAAEGMRLLVQGEGQSREAMTDELKSDGSTVLFGAQSFWEGVDVAGDALSCVVIARLPFAQAGSPIVEARGEKITREGGSSFRDYYLPEAVIKFRQGFGRLIRTKRDRGVVVVTDPRVVTKNYGATFRKSIPATVHTVTGTDELLTRVDEFFS